MANYNITLKDENGNLLYPKTFDFNVYNSNNQSLDNVINEKAKVDASNLTSANISTWRTTLGVPIMFKLWENPSPNSSMSETTVELSSSDYDFLLIVVKSESGTDAYQLRGLPPLMLAKGQSGLLTRTMLGYYSSLGDAIRIDTRNVNYVDDTHITFANGSILQWRSSSSRAENASSAVLIPTYIIGVKYERNN